MTEFKVIDGDRAHVLKKKSGSIIGTGDDKVFENILCSRDCADEDKDATCIENLSEGPKEVTTFSGGSALQCTLHRAALWAVLALAVIYFR